MSAQKVIDASKTKGELGKIFPALVFAFQMFFIILILSILVDTLNSYKEDSYAAIGRAA